MSGKRRKHMSSGMEQWIKEAPETMRGKKPSEVVMLYKRPRAIITLRAVGK